MTMGKRAFGRLSAICPWSWIKREYAAYMPRAGSGAWWSIMAAMFATLAMRIDVRGW